MAFKAEVKVYGEEPFHGNALVFERKEDAEDYARDLHSRWTQVEKWRVVSTDESANYEWGLGGLTRIQK